MNNPKAFARALELAKKWDYKSALHDAVGEHDKAAFCFDVATFFHRQALRFI